MADALNLFVFQCRSTCGVCPCPAVLLVLLLHQRRAAWAAEAILPSASSLQVADTGCSCLQEFGSRASAHASRFFRVTNSVVSHILLHVELQHHPLRQGKVRRAMPRGRRRHPTAWTTSSTLSATRQGPHACTRARPATPCTWPAGKNSREEQCNAAAGPTYGRGQQDISTMRIATSNVATKQLIQLALRVRAAASAREVGP